MRKLNQRRPKAVPIPRPPTPPHLVQVKSIRQLLFAKNNEQSAPQPQSDTSSWTSEASSTRHMSSCAGVENEPADAIEPNAEFPPPPADFLDDIRAFRKQQDMDDPLPSPILRPDGPPHLFRFARHLDCAVRNDSSFCANGSLNSSITETTESSCSPSVSPTASPLPSPSPTSQENSSMSGFPIRNPPSRTANSNFLFPPSNSLSMCHDANQTIRQKSVSATGQVTLAPLRLQSSFEKESIYQRIANGYGSLPRTGATSSLVRPPDYMTAMQRLSLSKCVNAVGTKSSTVTHIVRPMPPLKAVSNSGLASSSVNHASYTIGFATSSNHNRRSSISCGELHALARTEKATAGLNGPLIKGSKVKKRVSFSDQVELVSHSEDMNPEEHLPNPLLERVLGKAFLRSQKIQNS